MSVPDTDPQADRLEQLAYVVSYLVNFSELPTDVKEALKRRIGTAVPDTFCLVKNKRTGLYYAFLDRNGIAWTSNPEYAAKWHTEQIADEFIATDDELRGYCETEWFTKDAA